MPDKSRQPHYRPLTDSEYNELWTECADCGTPLTPMGALSECPECYPETTFRLAWTNRKWLYNWLHLHHLHRTD